MGSPDPWQPISELTLVKLPANQILSEYLGLGAKWEPWSGGEKVQEEKVPIRDLESPNKPQWGILENRSRSRASNSQRKDGESRKNWF